MKAKGWLEVVPDATVGATVPPDRSRAEVAGAGRPLLEAGAGRAMDLLGNGLIGPLGTAVKRLNQVGVLT